MKKVFIETHGCQMNVHDTEKALAALAMAGYSETQQAVEADLVLINTCMVREKPEQKVFKRVEQIRHQQVKANGAHGLFGVMGCVAQAEAERVFERNRDIRLVLGTQAIGELPNLVQELESGFEKAINVSLTKDADFFELAATDRTTRHIAYLSIIEGCNKFCSYCIVPFTRGRERSRAPLSILQEAQALAAKGFKEIHLLGQNVNSYGLSGRYRGSVSKNSKNPDLDEKTFAELLAYLAEESGIPRIKYATSYPRDFDAGVLAVMDSYDNLCEWIHLPAQSGSDKILKLMRRGYTNNEYLEKIAMIKRSYKDYAITGDIIVGFPGETEEDFQATLKMVAEVEYDGLFVFNYSARPNTAASALTDSVPEVVKTERLMKLIELQNRIQQRRYERYIGRTVQVLVERASAKDENDFAGHTRCHKTVNFPKANAHEGELVNVLISSVKKNSLRGEIVN